MTHPHGRVHLTVVDVRGKVNSRGGNSRSEVDGPSRQAWTRRQRGGTPTTIGMHPTFHQRAPTIQRLVGEAICVTVRLTVHVVECDAVQTRNLCLHRVA